MKKYLDGLLAAGKISKEEYDEAVALIPDTGEAWEAREKAHTAEIDRYKAKLADIEKREAAKDKIIATFTTAGNRNINPDADPFNEVVEYINKKRGINK